MFFLNYILFILLILFVHVIALSTQSLSSKKYFFGVYVNEIIIEEDSKTKINKDYLAPNFVKQTIYLKTTDGIKRELNSSLITLAFHR